MVPMLNLSVFLDDAAREVPDRPALVRDESVLTYDAVNALANQLAGALQADGVEPGQRVALSCPNIEWFPIVYYGILKAGAAVVPLNVLLKPREIAYHLEDSGAATYLCFAETSELPLGEMGHEAFAQVDGCRTMVVLPADLTAPSPLEGVPTFLDFAAGQPTTFTSADTRAEDTAVILYTSGTTGQPKGAELTHSNMVLNARLSDTMYPTTEPDTHLVTLPLFHSFGQTVQLNGGFYKQGTLVLMPRFAADEALQLMARHEVSFFAGVPTMYWAMLDADTGDLDLPGIAARLRIAISGGSAMPANVLRRFEERFGVTILEGYGLSETSPVVTFNRLDRPAKPGTVGLPVWGVSVRVVDASDQDVPVGEQGEILVRGHNVKAFVVREAGASVTEDELVAWSKAQMASYKYPRQVEFVDELPMNATGKILKRALRPAAL
jgi:long-chain acyl-CoA synthetase